MARTPETDQPDVDDVRRQADAFARQAYADAFERFEQLRKRPAETESNEALEPSGSEAAKPYHDRTGPVSICKKCPRG